MYIVPGPTLVYILSQCSTASIWGPKGPPFYTALLGILPLDSNPRTRARDPVFGPRVHYVNCCKYLPTTTCG